MENYMKLEFLADSKNELFARNVISSFCIYVNPTLSELCDIKTAVSEAVTNSIVHAYGGKGGKIIIEATINDNVLHISITDFGKGIDNIEKALEPFYTTPADEERSGMGFTIMQTFMNEFSLDSTVGKGTVVKMKKYFNVKEKNIKQDA